MGIGGTSDASALRTTGKENKTLASTVVSRENYVDYVKQVMSSAEWPWPEHVLCDPSKQPRFVSSVEELMHEIQFGCHMNQILVFPEGVKLLGLEDALDSRLVMAMGLQSSPGKEAPKTAYDVLERLSQNGMLNDLKGKVTFRREIESRDSVDAGGKGNSCLGPKFAALKAECPTHCMASVYLAEVRQLKPQKVSSGLRRKRMSTSSSTVRERMHQLGMDVQAMLYWDDYSEGLFCGAGCSGYDLHADCIPTSNVGSIRSGHKLLAIWNFPNQTKSVLRKHGRDQFVRPLTPCQVQSLEKACSVALGPPGSVYVFSGINAHAVCNVGFSAPRGPEFVPKPSLIVSSYEAFANLHPHHIEAMMTYYNKRQRCHDDDSDTDTDLEDFADDVREQARKLKQGLQRGEVAAPDAVQAALAALTTNGFRFSCKSDPEEEQGELHPKRQKQ
mmetsp:Transcript_128348/g.247382  ORF Transcript_128348/g.247382 Transcript_128348/m.247382 type:complete len:445 (-) Transcript_128348:110-1444(-)